MSLEEELFDHLKHRPAPVLFVGSGLTRRFAGTDTWSELLERFAAKTATPYARYSGAANGDKPKIASLIAEKFYDPWWDEDEYDGSRKAHPAPAGRESPLKIEVSNYFRQASGTVIDDPDLVAEIATLREASSRGIAAVVTTNFDQLTDSLFPGFTAYRSQDELLLSTPYGGRELFKIHGCCSDPDSLVLTASDYSSFEKRRKFLAAKLLTLFAAHPVIFLGYSIEDPHIQAIILDVAQALSAASIDRLEGNLIFVQRDHSGSAEGTIQPIPFTVDQTPVPMISVRVPNAEYGAVFRALARLRPKLPTRLVAQLKDEVYKIIESESPKEELYVRDIESLSDDEVDAQIEVVVGIGIRDQLGIMGFKGLSREELLRDLVTPDPRLASEKAAMEILTIVIPRIQANIYVPVFKYLAAAGALDEAGIAVPDHDAVTTSIRNRATTLPTRLHPYAAAGSRPHQLARTYPDIADLVAHAPTQDALEAVMCLERSTIDPNALRNLILEAMPGLDEKIPTHVARAICLYDYVVHGPGKVAPSTPV